MTKFPNSIFRLLQIVSIAFSVLLTVQAHAFSYYVLPTEGEQLSAAQSKQTSDLIRSFILKNSGNTLVALPQEAEFILRPKVLVTPEFEVLTIEKTQGDEVLIVSQVQIEKEKGLRMAAQEALIAVLGAAPPAGSKEYLAKDQLASDDSLKSATTTAPPDEMAANEQIAPLEQKPEVGRTSERPPVAKTIYHYWTVGVGVFDLNNLHSQHAHLAINGGHEWNITDQIGVYGMGEAVLPTSNNDDAYLLDLAGGATYYLLPTSSGSPYATANLGLGYARTGEHNSNGGGFAYGAGLGYQFHRAFVLGRGLGYDLQVHYASVLNDLGSGFPNVIGLRFSINF